MYVITTVIIHAQIVYCFNNESMQNIYNIYIYTSVYMHVSTTDPQALHQLERVRFSISTAEPSETALYGPLLVQEHIGNYLYS